MTQTLTTLDLEGNQIRPNGMQQLANALQINKVTLGKIFDDSFPDPSEIR